ncbi:hypothetical protein BDR03DRAFT_939453 [Suillus americanus]|nr:hypothetical protein BDR03DRAFT_939453 [Suillus americanus]
MVCSHPHYLYRSFPKILLLTYSRFGYTLFMCLQIGLPYVHVRRKDFGRIEWI